MNTTTAPQASKTACACRKATPGERDTDGYAHGARACQYPDVRRTSTGWERA